MSIRPRTGRLLVAQPTLRDPNFDHTVVMVLEHSEDGAIGVVLNRPSGFDVNGALPNWARRATHPAVVFVGGPVVDGGTAICLARAGGLAPETAFKPVMPGVGTLDVSQAPDTVGEGHRRGQAVRRLCRVGGRAAGRRDRSGRVVRRGCATGVDVFTTDPLGLWRAVLGRQRGQLAWFAKFPTEINLN